MSTVVDGFQGELSRISTEVRDLQTKSESYNLGHKKGVQRLLDTYLEQTVVTREFAEFLCKGQIDTNLEEYLENLNTLSEMIFYVQAPPGLIAQNAKSLADVRPDLDKLKHAVG